MNILLYLVHLTIRDDLVIYQIIEIPVDKIRKEVVDYR